MSDSIKNLVIVIPAYEPPEQFVKYAESAAGIAKALVVVNDGSSEAYNCVFSQISDIENAVCLSYGANRGKGYALKQALQYCVSNFCPEDIIVTADCDGQHSLKDVKKVYETARLHSGALILGSRDFNLPNVPKRSRLGNTQIRRIFRMLYGIDVYDTQTGLRGFSVSLAREYLNVRGDRFEYEMGVLIHSKKKEIPIYETQIKTIYPEQPKEHVSHFRTFADTARVLGVVFKNLNWYILSSALSGIIDIGVFFVLSSLVLGEISALNTLIATATARVVSSVVNYLFNCKYVFGGKSKKSVLRYYFLWLCQLCASYGFVFLFGNVVGGNLVIMKLIGDVILGFFSMRIQRAWVFKNQNSGELYGYLASIARNAARLFSKEYRCNVLPQGEGVVYVCRHLNMHGPYTSLKWLKFHVHPMILQVFFERGSCYRQYADYTFTERVGKKKRSFNFKAFVLSRFVPSLIKSIRAIPVYRKSVKLPITFRKSVECLERGESIIVYPDVDYTADKNTLSEIYDGFLYLGQLYKKKTGKSLKFVPLYIDEENKTINELGFVAADSYNNDREAAAQYLKLAINGQNENVLKKC